MRTLAWTVPRPAVQPLPRERRVSADRAASLGIIVELPIATEVLVILLLILANGVFAMSEMAVVAARKVRLQQRADDGDERAEAALQLAQSSRAVPLHRAGRHHAGRHPGRRLRRRHDCREAGGADRGDRAAAGAVRRTASRWASWWRSSPFLSLIIGELVPKNIGLKQPRDHRLVGGAADDVAGARRRAVRGAADRHHQSHPAHLRHQGPGRAAPDRRRDQGGHQPGRGDRRARKPTEENDRPARVPAGRSARRRRS